MLAESARDWCHFYIEWQRPRLIEMIDHATGLDHRYLKVAYMILEAPLPRGEGLGEGDRTTPTLALPPQGGGKDLYRVVSSLLSSKGKIELVLCGGNGEMHRIRRLDKNASSSNEDFGNVQRGDIVRFTENKRPGDCRADDLFTIIHRFNA